MNSMLITNRRASPDVSNMFVHRDKQGTIWAFENKKKLDKFLKRKPNDRVRNYLSPREILSQTLGLTNIYYHERTNY